MCSAAVEGPVLGAKLVDGELWVVGGDQSNRYNMDLIAAVFDVGGADVYSFSDSPAEAVSDHHRSIGRRPLRVQRGSRRARHGCLLRLSSLRSRRQRPLRVPLPRLHRCRTLRRRDPGRRRLETISTSTTLPARAGLRASASTAQGCSSIAAETTSTRPRYSLKASAGPAVSGLSSTLPATTSIRRTVRISLASMRQRVYSPA